MVLFPFLVLVPTVHAEPWQSDRRVAYWDTPQGGAWLNSSNWAESYPGIGRYTSAVFNVGSGYGVSLSQDLEISDLYILDELAVITIESRARLATFDRFVNDGLVRVNADSASGIAELAFSQDTLLSGQGTIELNAVNVAEQSQILTQGNLITIGRAQRITGAGLLKGVYHNTGYVFAGKQGGLGLDINFRFTQADEGVIAVQGSTLNLREGASLEGGMFDFGDDGVVSLAPGSKFRPAQTIFGINTTVRIHGGEVEYSILGQQPDLIQIMSDGGTCLLQDNISVDGAIEINAGPFNQGGILQTETSVQISGMGEIELLPSQFGSQTAAKLQAVGSGAITIGSGITVLGSGVIAGLDNGVVINNGTVRVPNADSRIFLAGRVGGGHFEIDAGVLEVGQGSTVINATFTATNGGIVESRTSELMNPVFADGTDLHVGRGTVKITGRPTFASNIYVDPDSSSSDSVLLFESFPILDGSATVHLGRYGVVRDSTMTGQAAIPESFPVVGSGYINGTFFFESVVTANNPSQPLYVSGVANGGTFIADHAELWALGDHANGEFISDGGLIRLGSSDFVNATLRRINGGDIRLIPNANLTLTSCFAEVSLDICDTSVVSINGMTEIHGTHTILDRGTLQLGSPILTGSGSILMRGHPEATAQPTIYMSGTAGQIGVGIPIRGSGRIQTSELGRFSSLSEIVADDPFNSMRLRGRIGPVVAVIADGGSLLLENSLSLSETTIDSQNGGWVGFTEGDIELVNLTINTPLNLSNGNTDVSIRGTIVNNSQIVIGASEVGAGATLGAPKTAEIHGHGVIELSAIEGLALPNLFGSERLTIGSGQQVIGDGRLGGTIELQGKIDPGGTLRNFEVSRLELAESAEVHLDIDGMASGDFDYIRILGGGWAELQGTLSIRLDDTYVPSLGDRWQIFLGGSVRGRFSHIHSSTALPNGWVYQVVPLGSGGELVLSCRGDRNGDGARDFFDVFDFISDFNFQDTSADMNSDGSFDFYDVTLFIQDFQSECSP